MSDGGGDRFCGRCKKLEEQLITLNHDRYAFEDEMKVPYCCFVVAVYKLC